uniref:(northern house mosquito) hypothetical protein n=1 Tax=Culex pipiens TaxID=7175 RepID=A0A8D8C4N0_CULPI
MATTTPRRRRKMVAVKHPMTRVRGMRKRTTMRRMPAERMTTIRIMEARSRRRPRRRQQASAAPRRRPAENPPRPRPRAARAGRPKSRKVKTKKKRRKTRSTRCRTLSTIARSAAARLCTGFAGRITAPRTTPGSRKRRCPVRTLSSGTRPSARRTTKHRWPRRANRRRLRGRREDPEGNPLQLLLPADVAVDVPERRRQRTTRMKARRTMMRRRPRRSTRSSGSSTCTLSVTACANISSDGRASAPRTTPGNRPTISAVRI